MINNRQNKSSQVWTLRNLFRWNIHFWFVSVVTNSVRSITGYSYDSAQSIHLNRKSYPVSAEMIHCVEGTKICCENIDLFSSILLFSQILRLYNEICALILMVNTVVNNIRITSHRFEVLIFVYNYWSRIYHLNSSDLEKIWY